MINLDLHLEPLQALRLSSPMLDQKIRKLEKITSHLNGVGALDTPDQIAAVREKVRQGCESREAFSDYTAFPRREARLLSLYLMDLSTKGDRVLLPPFDQGVVTSILGDWSRELKKHIRRQATLLYFTHFGEERIPALNLLAKSLLDSWKTESEDRILDNASIAYRVHADLLFSADAPSKVAGEWYPGESVDQLADRFGIPPGGEFRERLLEEVILERVRTASADKTGKDLDGLVADSRERHLSAGYPLGAEAVRILIDRSIAEFQGKVPAGWREQLVIYACDPRIPNPAEQSRWWGWASRLQRETALRALTELTLRQFIALLRDSLGGTYAGEPFEKRADMLLKIFKLGKVIDARLAVHEDTFRTLSPKTRQVLRPLQTGGGPQHTSFICLKCENDVYLIEGTHSFALRGFLGEENFPIPRIWSNASGTYFHDSKFRVHEHTCDFYQRHHTGDWVWDFNHQLRQSNIPWHGL